MAATRLTYFHHEKLAVYQESIAFIAWLSPLLEALQRPGDIKEQLERASSSIPLNIAEGNGKYSMKDRCRSFDIANGSALECAACLDVLVARARLTADQVQPAKERLSRIVKMLIGLAKRLTERNYEASPDKPR
jgi:four helix bundle protein